VISRIQPGDSITIKDIAWLDPYEILVTGTILVIAVDAESATVLTTIDDLIRSVPIKNLHELGDHA
jgi:hypothetical protein